MLTSSRPKVRAISSVTKPLRSNPRLPMALTSMAPSAEEPPPDNVRPVDSMARPSLSGGAGAPRRGPVNPAAGALQSSGYFRTHHLFLYRSLSANTQPRVIVWTLKNQAATLNGQVLAESFVTTFSHAHLPSGEGVPGGRLQ